jgi:hypothetical protein
MLFRVHRLEHHPIFFGPPPAEGEGSAPNRVPESRFDSASGRFGVLYVSMALEAALVETLLRNPRRRLVAASRIAERAYSDIRVMASMALVSLIDTGLQQLSLDNSIATGPYEPCGLWADALWDHPEAPDGLLYRSRHDPAQRCIALFERPRERVEPAGEPVPLRRIQSTIAAILDRYGRGIDPGE